MSERCERWDLPVESCACPDHRGGADDKPARGPSGPAWEAKFDGWCLDCDHAIHAGERITWGPSGGYLHEECAK